MSATKTISNRTWAQLQIGDTASLERVCTERDLFLFAHVSGNTNPLMLPASKKTRRRPMRRSRPSMWVGSLISAVLGNILPGPGTLYRSQTFEFMRRVHVGDQLAHHRDLHRKARRAGRGFRHASSSTWTGRAGLQGHRGRRRARRAMSRRQLRELPALIMEQKDHFAHLIALAAQLPRLKTVVVCPEDHNSLGGALLSADKGLIEPILIGDPARIAKAAKELGRRYFAIAGSCAEKNHRVAADRAVAMVLAGEAGAVMKGDLHSDDLLAAVVKKDGGLRSRAAHQPCLRARRARASTNCCSFPTRRSISRPTC